MPNDGFRVALGSAAPAALPGPVTEQLVFTDDREFVFGQQYAVFEGCDGYADTTVAGDEACPILDTRYFDSPAGEQIDHALAATRGVRRKQDAPVESAEETHQGLGGVLVA